MVTVQRPAFVPDPGLDREEMESLQREIADEATFADAFGFDPAAIDASTTSPSAQTEFGTSDESASGSPPADQPIVAGIDQAFRASDGSDAGPGEFDEAVSAVVAMRGDEVIERVHAATPLEIPYIPGLLAFREGESILAALAECSVEPDLLLLDGSGRIHFREAGIATHVGVTVELPAVGVAKSLLCGRPQWDAARPAGSAPGAADADGQTVGTDGVTAGTADGQPTDEAGDVTGGASAGAASGDDLPAGTVVPIEAADSMTTPDGAVVGAAVQTRQFDSPNRSINPLYVSPGHRVGWATAAEIALASADAYKLPEPIRRADRWVGELTAAE